MKNLFKNKMYLSMIIGTLFALISLLMLFFIKERIYFTIILILNIFINFMITSFLLLVKDNISNSLRFNNISLYLLVTLFLMVMDVVIISNTWDLNVYSNLMYIKNIELYVSIYSLFVLIMTCMSIYVVLKSIANNKTNIRQKSAK